MDFEPKKKRSFGEWFFAWMAEPEHARGLEANDPATVLEFERAQRRFIRENPPPPEPPSPPKPPDPAKPALRWPWADVEEAERALGWLSLPQWQKTGEGKIERLHPVMRDAIIEHYRDEAADIESGAVDPMKLWGLSKEEALAKLKAQAAPFVAAQEQFKRDADILPPIVLAHYRRLWPWLVA
ncbi:MAG: hypothetical protein HY077_13880 [Elusimicrobia bacterium]|nr:hypothetical protein [Elusimicrobiota bacterium]